MTEPKIHSVWVGQPKVIHDERGEWVSSIARDRVSGPVHVLAAGLQGDKVTQPYHGGADSALCVHLCDHYEFWRVHFGIDLPCGHLGENLTIDSLREEDVCVGDVVRAGSALVQVSGARVPCTTQGRRAGKPDWVRLTVQQNRTGFYLRVLEPGMVEAGDSWELVDRCNPAGSIPALNHCFYLKFDREFASRVVAMTGLGEWWKEQFREKLRTDAQHWSGTMAN